MTFDEFYKGLGLSEYPFTIFTTELESDKSSDLFEPSTEHGPMVESFKASRSIIVLGERGVGKTAVKEDFVRNASQRIMTIITNFEELDLPPNTEQVYKLILKNLLLSAIDYLTVKPLKIFRLNKEEKVYLSFLLFYYSTPDSLELMKNKISKIQHNFLIRFINTIYNNSRSVANYAGTVLENSIKRYIAQNFGVIPFYTENEINEYFPELKLNTFDDFEPRETTFYEIERIADLITNLSGKKACVILDSIDEDLRIKNDEDIISKFIESLLSDTKLLSCPKFQQVYFIWSTPYRFVIDSVRSQKFYTPTIRWDNEHLEKVLNTRLSVFSNKSLSSIYEITEFNSLEEIKPYFEITNGIPRDLWHFMNKVFEEQYSQDRTRRYLEKSSFDRALKRIVKETNYYEYYPRKSNARADSMDVYSYFGYLFKLKKNIFTKTEFRENAGAGGSTNNYLVNMERIGIMDP
jgi:hypothetical protein